MREVREVCKGGKRETDERTDAMHARTHRRPTTALPRLLSLCTSYVHTYIRPRAVDALARPPGENRAVGLGS